MTNPAFPPPATPPPQSPNRPKPLIPQWVVVVIAGGLLVTYMAANNFTGGETVGVALILAAGAFIFLVIRALIRLGDKRPEPLVVNASVALPPPGWYLDPQGSTRWFDGRQWTEHVQPPASA